MNVNVQVTDAGLLQVSVDGVSWPPLPVEVVPALAAKVPEAQAAEARQQVTAAVRVLTDVLASSAEHVATVQFGASGVEAEVDAATFERAQVALGVPPGPAGDLRHGQVVIRRKPTPAPEPEPTQRTVTDGVTTAADTTVTSATAAFAAVDVGLPVAGGTIPAGATITAVLDAQTVTVSAPPAATATGVTLTVG